MSFPSKKLKVPSINLETDNNPPQTSQNNRNSPQNLLSPRISRLKRKTSIDNVIYEDLILEKNFSNQQNIEKHFNFSLNNTCSIHLNLPQINSHHNNDLLLLQNQPISPNRFENRCDSPTITSMPPSPLAVGKASSTFCRMSPANISNNSIISKMPFSLKNENSNSTSNFSINSPSSTNSSYNLENNSISNNEIELTAKMNTRNYSNDSNSEIDWVSQQNFNQNTNSNGINQDNFERYTNEQSKQNIEQIGTSQIGQSGQTGQAGQTGYAGQTGHAGQASQTNQTNQNPENIESQTETCVKTFRQTSNPGNGIRDVTNSSFSKLSNIGSNNGYTSPITPHRKFITKSIRRSPAPLIHFKPSLLKVPSTSKRKILGQEAISPIATSSNLQNSHNPQDIVEWINSNNLQSSNVNEHLSYAKKLKMGTLNSNLSLNLQNNPFSLLNNAHSSSGFSSPRSSYSMKSKSPTPSESSIGSNDLEVLRILKNKEITKSFTGNLPGIMIKNTGVSSSGASVARTQTADSPENITPTTSSN